MKSKHSPKVFKIVACLRESRTEGFEISYQIEAEKIFLGKKTFAKNPSIQIQNNILSCEETVKLLGIDIDYQLKFD